LHDLFVHTLQDIYFAEQTIAKKLPKMAEKAHSSQLRNAFETHLAETREHVHRLEEIFSILGAKGQSRGMPGDRGITEEAEELIKEINDPETRDAAMLAAAQAVEQLRDHAVTARSFAWAEEMGHTNVMPILQSTWTRRRRPTEAHAYGGAACTRRAAAYPTIRQQKGVPRHAF
jgi:ferritin-like metal-binding protein YciE